MFHCYHVCEDAQKLLPYIMCISNQSIMSCGKGHCLYECALLLLVTVAKAWPGGFHKASEYSSEQPNNGSICYHVFRCHFAEQQLAGFCFYKSIQNKYDILHVDNRTDTQANTNLGGLNILKCQLPQNIVILRYLRFMYNKCRIVYTSSFLFTLL